MAIYRQYINAPQRPRRYIKRISWKITYWLQCAIGSESTRTNNQSQISLPQCARFIRNNLAYACKAHSSFLVCMVTKLCSAVLQAQSTQKTAPILNQYATYYKSRYISQEQPCSATVVLVGNMSGLFQAGHQGNMNSKSKYKPQAIIGNKILKAYKKLRKITERKGCTENILRMTYLLAQYRTHDRDS